MDDTWKIVDEDVPEFYENYSIYKNIRPNGDSIKIQVIKEIRYALHIGLKDAKDITDIMEATGSGVLTSMSKQQALRLVEFGFSVNDVYGNRVTAMTENYLPDDLFVIE